MKLRIKLAVIAIMTVSMLSGFSSSAEESNQAEHAGAAHKKARSGEELSKACAACHGADGVSISADFPNLAGQHSSYMMHALQQYRSGERENAIMQSFVKDLSDAEIRNLANFYSLKTGLGTLPESD